MHNYCVCYRSFLHAYMFCGIYRLKFVPSLPSTIFSFFLFLFIFLLLSAFVLVSYFLTFLFSLIHSLFFLHKQVADDAKKLDDEAFTTTGTRGPLSGESMGRHSKGPHRRSSLPLWRCFKRRKWVRRPAHKPLMTRTEDYFVLGPPCTLSLAAC